jgi:hypothetical protein
MWKIPLAADASARGSLPLPHRASVHLEPGTLPPWRGAWNEFVTEDNAAGGSGDRIRW